MERRDFLKFGFGTLLAGSGLWGCGKSGNSNPSGTADTTLPPQTGSGSAGTTIYIDPTLMSGGSGSLANPYGLADGVAYFNGLTGDQGGNAILFRSGTIAHLPQYLSHAASNYTLGYYGTGAKPVLSAAALKTGAWKLYSGNVWSIWHPNNDAFYYDGQAASGFVTTSRPFGTRLTIAGTLANCQALSFSSYYDAGAQIMYVNLDGANPNSEVMLYSSLRHVLHYNGGTGLITLDALVFADSFYCNIFFEFATSGASGLIMTDVETYQAGAPSGADVRSNCQIIGPSGSVKGLTDVHIERFTSKDSWMASFDLLYVKGAIVHDFEIDNCGVGLGLWNDVQGCRFSQGTITNIFTDPDWYPAFSAQQVEFGIYAPCTGFGKNGKNWNNLIENVTVAHVNFAPLYLESGHNFVIRDCTFICNSDSLTLPPYGVVFSTQSHGDDATDRGAQIISGNVFVQEGALNMFTLFVGDPTKGRTFGDYNLYIQLAPSSPWRSEYNGVVDGTFIAHQASCAPFDANSRYLENADQSIVYSGDWSMPAGHHARRMLANLRVTSRSILDNYVPGLITTGPGNAVWETPSSPPSGAPILDGSLVSGSTAQRTYYVRTTYVTNNGETLPSQESKLLVATNHVLTVASPVAQTGAVGWDVYVSTETGTETKQNTVPIDIGIDWIEPVSGLVTGQTVPTLAPQNGLL